MDNAVLKSKVISQYLSSFLVSTFLFVTSLFTSLSIAEPNPYALLDEMVESAKTLTYQGTLVYRRVGLDTHMETLKF